MKEEWLIGEGGTVCPNTLYEILRETILDTVDSKLTLSVISLCEGEACAISSDDCTSRKLSGEEALYRGTPGTPILKSSIEESFSCSPACRK